MAISADQPITAKAYKALIEAYKEQNPLKYADKKAGFDIKLKALEQAEKPAKKTKE